MGFNLVRLGLRKVCHGNLRPVPSAHVAADQPRRVAHGSRNRRMRHNLIQGTHIIRDGRIDYGAQANVSIASRLTRTEICRTIVGNQGVNDGNSKSFP